MLTILSVIGTRPEAIKMAPVVRELAQYPHRVRSIVCVTSQHREMLDQVLELFNIRPDYDLDVMQPDQALSPLTAELIARLDPVVEHTRPEWIIAQGDTTTVLAAALVAFYHRTKFGHIEAGLRTGDRYNPFPEEMNRRLADSLAELLFAPTEHAKQALLREGYPEERIVVTGNTVIDALLTVAKKPYDWSGKPLAHIINERQLVLVTCHRRETIGEPLREICLAIRELANTFGKKGVHFVYPVHMNPRIRKTVYSILAQVPNVSLVEPLDYHAMVDLMRRSIIILTDSGGIQEEAPTLGVPVLIMRELTEREEALQAGVAKLIGTKKGRIVEEASHLLLNPDKRKEMIKGVNPYGDGKAAKRIVLRLIY